MEAAQYINEKRLTDIFLDLIRINSPSFGERELGGFLEKQLKARGCSVEIQEYGPSFNIVARKRGTVEDAPLLLLSGHMDTIEPTEGIQFSTEGGVIRSVGPTVLGADDKSALAQILESITVLDERGLPHGDLEIVFTSAEERGLFGAKHLDYKKLRSRHALVLDSSGSVGNVVIGAPTHLNYEMKITGRAAHAGIEPEKGVSSIKVASRIIAEIPDGRLRSDTTANVGVIQGGTATNVVPLETRIRGEIRSHDMQALDDTKTAIFDIARRLAQENHAVIGIDESEEYKSFSLAEDDPFLELLEKVFHRSGILPVKTISGGGSDANIFHQHGIKAINISNGMQRVHSSEEYIHVKDLAGGCLVVLLTMNEFGQLPGIKF